VKDNPWGDAGVPGKARRRANRKSLLLRLGAGLALTAFVGIVALGAYSLLNDSHPTKRRVVQISLLVPPPPPPPPPEAKPPEPVVEPPDLVVKERVAVREPEQPQQAKEAPTPSEPIRTDVKGSGSGDSIDLGPGNGGQDGLAIGGGGSDRARFGAFAAAIESQLKEHLHKNETLRKSGYRVVMRLWINPDGWIERYELVGSAGDPEVDRSLRTALAAMPRLEQRPPAQMPQPVTLRVTARAVNG
jgi:periplasmic protein TonB